MKRWTQGMRRAALVLPLLATAGCAGIALEDVLGGMGGMGGSTVEGEIRYVDERDREIELRSSGGFGGTTRVRYDSGTEVFYRDRRYSVSALEPGDLVSIRLERDSRGGRHADEIHVRRSARDGGSGGGGEYDDYPSGGIRSLQGRVGWVDTRRGRFELEEGSYGRTYVVSLPYNPGSSTVDRFRRLRRGDNIRIEAELLGQDRVELVRFR